MTDLTSDKKILVVDDHGLFRKALCALLETYGLRCVEAENGIQGLKQLTRHDVDLVITDDGMPAMDGFEFTRQIKQTYPAQKILTLTLNHSANSILKMIELEVDGYLSKDTTPDNLIEAIKQILNGRTYYSQKVAAEMANILRKTQKNEDLPTDSTQLLSDKEIEILKLIISEHTVAEIAQELSLSIRTIETYKYRMMEKTKCKSTIGLLRYAYDNAIE